MTKQGQRNANHAKELLEYDYKAAAKRATAAAAAAIKRHCPTFLLRGGCLYHGQTVDEKPCLVVVERTAQQQQLEARSARRTKHTQTRLSSWFNYSITNFHYGFESSHDE